MPSGRSLSTRSAGFFFVTAGLAARASAVAARGPTYPLFGGMAGYIPDDKHVDIQDLFRIDNCPRTGMAAMAAKLIHPKYAGMKDNFVSDFEKRQGHDYWDFKPLADMNLEYADRKSTRLNSSHSGESRMPSSA